MLRRVFIAARDSCLTPPGTTLLESTVSGRAKLSTDRVRPQAGMRQSVDVSPKPQPVPPKPIRNTAVAERPAAVHWRQSTLTRILSRGQKGARRERSSQVLRA